MRVVNRLERDVVGAEWEDWVRGEGGKCQRVERMVREVQDGRGGKNVKAKEAEMDVGKELGIEFVEYCRSCRGEIEELVARGESVLM